MSKRDDVTTLILRTSVILAITRTVQILYVPLLIMNRFTYVLVTDDFHHYQVGLAASVLMIFLYKYAQKYLAWILPFCLAWLIEEHLVIIEELGGKIPWYYLSKPDTIVIYLLALIGMAASLTIGARYKGVKR